MLHLNAYIDPPESSLNLNFLKFVFELIRFNSPCAFVLLNVTKSSIVILKTSVNLKIQF